MSKMSTEVQEAPLPRRHVLNGATMGTRYSAIFFTPGDIDENLAPALFAAVDAVDRQMSNWKPLSDLSRLNSAPLGEWVHLPRELMTVLSASLRIGRMSNGAFDIGVGDLVNAWGFGPQSREINGAEIPGTGGAMRKSAADALEIDESANRVRKHGPASLDLCGIAKGFGVDEMARCLDRFNITSYLVGIDGEMRARGLKPGDIPWSVAIERPDRDKRDVMGVMALEDASIATSGDYRHWANIGGETVSHTMDPGNAGPVRNPVASVTVLAQTCMEADALATALMVLGEKKGPEFARAHRLDALFIIRAGDSLSEIGLGKFGADA
ncbi:MAG: FAD:protein FMN transferase [Allorhizobium sp.]